MYSKIQIPPHLFYQIYIFFLEQQRSWYVLTCLWDGAYKRTLAVNRKE